MAEEWICPICLDDSPEDCHYLVPCNHRFHTRCLIESLRRCGPICPYCRGHPDDPIIEQAVIQEDEPIIQEDEPIIQEDEPMVHEIVDIVEDPIFINDVEQFNDNHEIVTANNMINIIRNNNNNNIHNQLRGLVMEEINNFNGNRFRQHVINHIMNSFLTNQEKDTLINIINDTVNNVINENNLINNFNHHNNLLNMLINFQFQNLNNENVINQMEHIIINNINFINNENMRDALLDALRDNNIMNNQNDLINNVNNKCRPKPS